MSYVPNKYNDGRRLLGRLGIIPPNYLARTVYALLARHSYNWNAKTKKWEAVKK